MAALDSRKVQASLEKKGFTESANKSGDHIRFEYWHDGKLTRCNTKLSHNGQDINDSLISLMSKQMQLSKKEFKEFVECTFSQEDYVSKLKGLKLIPTPDATETEPISNTKNGNR